MQNAFAPETESDLRHSISATGNSQKEKPFGKEKEIAIRLPIIGIVRFAFRVLENSPPRECNCEFQNWGMEPIPEMITPTRG